ncbi:MAG TPA: hypothetical protein VMP08_21825 [Anaerolineae bacterium]|nr:hypothetical protein [Anaerolineae bacterium]
MHTPFVRLLLTVTLLSVLMSAEQAQWFSAQSPQSDCVEQVVQNAETLVHKQLDVNQDGIPDDVVIYGNGDLYLLVVANGSSLGCKVMLNDWLTSRQLINPDEKKVVKVQQVELVDLTGDDQPELHIWLDLSTFAFRESEAFHAIYKLQGRSLERVFVTSQCLQVSSFEFRTAPDGAQVIYWDEDYHCDPPSSSRDYAIYRWDANTSQFKRIESGKVAKETADTFWQAVLIVLMELAAILIVGILFVALVAFLLRKGGPKQT